MTDEEKLEFVQPILDAFHSSKSALEFRIKAAPIYPTWLLRMVAGYEPWPETVEELRNRLDQERGRRES